MTRRIFATLVLLSFVPIVASADQELLASAKTLYESASYEAALSELNTIKSAEHLDAVDTYRALCFLGLGRTRDAERALEVIVSRAPLLMLSEAEYSPRIVSMFRDVRRRALPRTAQQLYALAKSDYEGQNYETAAGAFKQTLEVLADVDPKDMTPALTDLKQLADGFLSLAEGKIVRQPPPPETVVAAEPEPAAIASPVAQQPEIFTLADVGVTPPVAIDQRMPPWNFRLGSFDRTFTGRLEITIDEAGSVEIVNVINSVWGPYDAQLLQAARRWRYRPATKAGKPVKFRRVLDINIDPTLKPIR